MSKIDTNSLDQIDPRVAIGLREKRKRTIENSLAKRHRKEKSFRIFGFSAVMVGFYLLWI